jgi:hypothetical protein
MYPHVLQLTVHVPGMHMVAYNDRDDLRNVINHEQSQKSMLTEYFRMNNVILFATSLLYGEFPEYYRWDRTEKEWLQRKQRTQIDKMVYACPTEGERYYLRVLLNHVRGATSFDNLKTTCTTLTSFHDFFTQYICMYVVVHHKNSLWSLSGCIFLYRIFLDSF